MDLITTQMAVGSRVEAEQAALLRDHGITDVVSLEPARCPQTVRHYLLPIRDRVPPDEVRLARIIACIGEAHRPGRRILVHCEMGISRSPAIAAGYLIVSEGLDADAAIGRVIERRPVADPHPALRAALVHLAARERCGRVSARAGG